MASGALDLFHKLVWQHQVAPEDFLEQMMELQGGGTVMANKPPGHSLLIHLLNDTRLLKMVGGKGEMILIGKHAFVKKD